MTKMNDIERKYYQVCPDFHAETVLESGSICIINPRDEMSYDGIQHSYKVCLEPEHNPTDHSAKTELFMTH